VEIAIQQVRADGDTPGRVLPDDAGNHEDPGSVLLPCRHPYGYVIVMQNGRNVSEHGNSVKAQSRCILTLPGFLTATGTREHTIAARS